VPIRQALPLGLLLGAVSLGTCLDERLSGTSARTLAKDSVIPVTNVQGDSRPHCRTTKVPVALAPGRAARYTIVGELCLPVGRDQAAPPCRTGRIPDSDSLDGSQAMCRGGGFTRG